MANFIPGPCNEGVIHSQPASAPCTPGQERWVLLATILGSSMVFIDGSVVNVALAALQRDLNLSVIGIQWVVESYALFLAALLLVGGSLGDFYGRRRIFNLGVIVFAVASVLCGLAQDGGQLIAFRAAQGIGGALLVPGSLAIISASFTEEKRGRAIGTWAGFTAITAALGPVLGGWLIDSLSWRWIFFINVPLAIAVLAATVWQVPESRNQEAARLDWWGALLAVAGLGTLVFGLIESSTAGFTDPLVLAALGLAAVIVPAFLIVESRQAEPMLPLGLFRSRMFSGANLISFFLYGAMGAGMFFFPLNLIQVQDYSATAAGAALAPGILILFVLSRWAGGLINRYGAKLPLVVGPLVTGIGFALFAVPGVGGSYWTTFFPAVVVMGLGLAISVAPLTTTVMNSVEERHSGIASGINNANTRAANLIFIAVLGIVMFITFDLTLNDRLSSIDMSPETRQLLDEQTTNLGAMQVPAGVTGGTAVQLEEAINAAFVASFRLVMLIAAGLAILSAVVAARTIEGPGVVAMFTRLPSDVRHTTKPRQQLPE